MIGLGMLSMEDQATMEARLNGFLVSAESLWSALVDKSGNLYVQAGNTGGLDLNTVSALAAGSFAATREIARRLGEGEFTALYHEGQNSSILMNALDFDCLLVTVFDQKTNIGLVRFYAQQLTHTLNADLHLAQQRNEQTEPLQIEADIQNKALF